MEGSSNSILHSESSSVPTANIINILNELKSMALDPNHVQYSTETENSYAERCNLSILLGILLSEDKELAPSLISKVCEELANNFNSILQVTLWRLMDCTKRSGIMYGLILLQGSSCSEIKLRAKDIMRDLLEYEFTREGAYIHYHNSLLYVMGDIKVAKDEFQATVGKWSEVKKEIELKDLIEGINLVVDLIKEDDPNILQPCWHLLSYFVLHCQHLKILLYFFESVASTGMLPNSEAIKVSEDPLSVWVYWIIEDAVCVSSSSINVPQEYGDLAKQLAVCHQRYNQPKKTLLCSLLVTLIMADTKQKDLVNSIVIEIEILESGAKIWFDGATLLDRLMLIVEEYQDVKAKKGVLDTLHFWASKMRIVHPSLDSHWTTLIKFFSSGSNDREVQSLCGQCLLKFLDYDSYPMMSSFYSNAMKEMPKSRDMPPGLKKLHQQLMDILNKSLEASMELRRL